MTPPGFSVVVVPSRCRNCGDVLECSICRECFAAYCARSLACCACDCPDEDDDEDE